MPARARIYPSGSVTVAFRLPDGRSFPHSTRLAANGDLPFYRWLSRAPELMTGWLNLPAGSTNAAGTLVWVNTGTNGFALRLTPAATQ